MAEILPKKEINNICKYRWKQIVFPYQLSSMQSYYQIYESYQLIQLGRRHSKTKHNTTINKQTNKQPNKNIVDKEISSNFKAKSEIYQLIKKARRQKKKKKKKNEYAAVNFLLFQSRKEIHNKFLYGETISSICSLQCNPLARSPGQVIHPSNKRNLTSTCPNC